MRCLENNDDVMVVELNDRDREIIGGLCSMINCMEVPNWWATEDGDGRLQLDERAFDDFYSQWTRMLKERVLARLQKM